MRPLCIDLYCGLGGWTEGFLAEGWDVIGFDIEQHVYGDSRYPAQLVLQDVLTIHGRQFRSAQMIVASSPCQAYSYMAMPWTKAKAKIAWYRDPAHPERIEALNALFNAPKRIQREACAAAGRHIPMIQENVRGAIPWVGRSQWNFGSFHLWGDVPALMPFTYRGVKVAGLAPGTFPPGGLAQGAIDRATKVGGFSWSDYGKPGYKAQAFNGTAQARLRDDAAQNLRERERERGVKSFTPNGEPLGKNQLARRHGSKSLARKQASAMIARIPLPLARHIASVYRPMVTA